MVDPELHTATEVLDYLAAADPLEIGRVLAAERTGLARAEILSRFPVHQGGRPMPPTSQ